MADLHHGVPARGRDRVRPAGGAGVSARTRASRRNPQGRGAHAGDFPRVASRGSRHCRRLGRALRRGQRVLGQWTVVLGGDRHPDRDSRPAP